jgi:hypothetical protein
MPKLKLTRDVLAQIAQGNQRAVAALEHVFEDVGSTFPSTIEEANALAGSALAVAQASSAALALLADAFARLDAAPAAPPHIDADDTAPRAHVGTISTQNADAVEVTGGTVDGTTIGATTAAPARVTDLTATGKFGCNGKVAQAAVASGGTVATTGATNSNPYGFTTATQANDIVTKLNTVINALVANGTLS